MNFQEYSDLLTSISASKEKTVCNICLDNLDVPAGIDCGNGKGRYVGEHLLATCRFPCGCTFHSACIAKCAEEDLYLCPTCRTPVIPDYPICPNCDEEIKPSDSVTTFPNSRILMHFPCSVAWLKVRGPRLPGQTREQMLEAIENIRPLSPIPPPVVAAPSSPSEPPPSQSLNRRPSTQRSTESDSQQSNDDDDDEVILLGELTRDSTGRSTWRCRSPILLD